MPSTPGSTSIIFGDLSHFVVRLSAMMVQRSVETYAHGSATYLSATYHDRMRVDSTVFDPSAGATPPIVYATLHAQKELRKRGMVAKTQRTATDVY